jgi:hypothetical protein
MSNGQFGMMSGWVFDWAVKFRAARATARSVEWKDFPDRVRITKTCSILPQVFPYPVRA